MEVEGLFFSQHISSRRDMVLFLALAACLLDTVEVGDASGDGDGDGEGEEAGASAVGAEASRSMHISR